MSVLMKKISRYGRDYKISEHFTLGEFQCRDGSDEVKYSTELLAMLEKLRAYGGFTITITSGYRTKKYNDSIGGASRSQHIDGTAADIIVKKDGGIVNAKLICCLCQTLGFRGIGYISGNATHVDMRPSGSYRGDERGGYAGNVNNDFYKYFNIGRAVIEGLKALEEEEMTQAQFNTMLEQYFSDKAKKEPADWSREAREWAEQNGIIAGSGNGEKQYLAFVTREQMVMFLYRLCQNSGGKITESEVARAMEAIAKEYRG